MQKSARQFLITAGDTVSEQLVSTRDSDSASKQIAARHLHRLEASSFHLLQTRRWVCQRFPISLITPDHLPQTMTPMSQLSDWTCSSPSRMPMVMYGLGGRFGWNSSPTGGATKVGTTQIYLVRTGCRHLNDEYPLMAVADLRHRLAPTIGKKIRPMAGLTRRRRAIKHFGRTGLGATGLIMRFLLTFTFSAELR